MSDNFYRALEERFRASQEEIRSRLEGYLPFLSVLCEVKPGAKAFDIGCGRGEWLKLLTELGIDASGVDLDDSMLAACHERGLNARNQDALQALQELPDGSMDLISAFHVVEHLKFDYLRSILKEALRVLTPQGLLILETPNTENLIVGANNFYLDPTHERPIPALFLEFLCSYAGFENSKIVRLQEDSVLHDSSVHIGLWQVLYGVSPDYAVVARKSLPAEHEVDPFSEVFAQDYGLQLHQLAIRHDQQAAAQQVTLEELKQQLGQQSQEILRLGEQVKRLNNRALFLIWPFQTLIKVARCRRVKTFIDRRAIAMLRYAQDKPRLLSFILGVTRCIPVLGTRVRALKETVFNESGSDAAGSPKAPS